MNKLWRRIISNKRYRCVALIGCVGVIISITILRIQTDNSLQGGKTQEETSHLFALGFEQKLKAMKENFGPRAKVGICMEDGDYSPFVTDDEIDKFFDENISDENQSDFSVNRLLPYEYIENTAYDGVSRDISCWGDSMTYGQASTDVTVPVGGENKRLIEPTYPSTLEMYSGIAVHNLGMTGETSVQIATRQGGTPMYIDSDVDITDGSDTSRVISTYTGNSIELSDFSGYVDRSNSIWYGSGLCYYDDDSGRRLCRVDSSGDVCTLQKYNIGRQSVKADDSIVISYLAEREHVLKTAISPKEDPDYMEQKFDTTGEPVKGKNNQIKEGQSETSAKEQSTTESAKTGKDETKPGQTETTKPGQTETTKPQATQAATSPYETTKEQTPTHQTIEQPTLQQTQPETEPEVPYVEPDTDPAHLGAGTVLMTKASIDRKDDLLILEMGSNGGWGNGYQDLIYQYDKMILYSGCKYYIIIGDTDDPQDVRADGVSENGIGIGDTAWEATLRKAYGAHFINMRVELIKNGLQYCGIQTSQADLDGYVNGDISRKLRTTVDNTHLNGFGYYAKGYAVYLKGRELGYW